MKLGFVVIQDERRAKMKYWNGSKIESCNLCEEPIDDCFIDGRMRRGSWAIMCLPCHALDGVGLGEGRGQLYRKQDDGKFLKVRG